MKRIRIVGLCLAAMLVSGVATAVSASANEFFVEKVGIGLKAYGITGEETEGLAGDAKLKSEIGSTKVVIICEGTDIEPTSEIFEINKSKETIQYSLCALENEATGEILTACSVQNPVANVKNVLEGAPGKLKLEQMGSNPITEITIKGASCALKVSKVAVTGTQICELPKGAEEKVVHEVDCVGSGSSLKFGTKAATYSGNVDIRLTKAIGTKEWSAR